MQKTTHDIAVAMVSETTQAVHIAQDMIAEAETAARAEMTASKHTDCRYCQAGLTNFLIATPNATEAETEAETQRLWENCDVCREEYAAHLTSIACKHGVRNWENCDACLDEWAEQHEMQALGFAYAEELNGTPMHEMLCGGVK